jgi:hypothetical protein
VSGFLLGSSLFVMHRVARRRAACIVRKHGFWPVPSYGLREAHSPNLVEEAFHEVRWCSAIYPSELYTGKFQPEGVLRELLVVGYLGDLGDVELPSLKPRCYPQYHPNLRVHQE